MTAVSGEWPGPGAVVSWESGPAGRGSVTERVLAYQPLAGQTVQVEDQTLRGRQTIAFMPEGEQVEVRLSLEYEIRRRSIFTPLVDLVFIRGAMERSLAATLARFGAELTATRRAERRVASRRMFVFKAAVVGAGTMGGEIAQTIANAEIPVVLKDVEQRFVRTGLDKARSLWQGRVDAGKMAPDELERKLALITGTTDYDQFGDVDFVIEAVPERMEIKQAVFAELDEVTPGHAMLASNTSSLSITEMGEATSRPEKVVGFHFFYPASVMRLIEVIEGDDTAAGDDHQPRSASPSAIRKMPIRCGEAPGFVVNRILNSSVSELWRYQEETGIDVKELDRIVAESKAAPMGPFFLTDLLGLDTVLHVAEHLHDSYGDRFSVHRRMQQLVAEGDLGAKTGKGFYEHG